MINSRSRAESARSWNDLPGWYPTGWRGVTGEWDGAGWTGRSRADDPGATPPPWRRRVLPFVGHLWFWMLVSGAAVVIAAAGLGGQGLPEMGWVALAAIGLTLACCSFIVMFWPLLRFGELTHFRLVVTAGIVSGVVGSYLAWGVQHFIEPVLGMPLSTDLWLAGPVEETSKLLVPVLLLACARHVFGDPRAGLLMVMISAAVFGIGEGIDYLQKATDAQQLLLVAITRGAAEGLHVAMTAIAAALIWITAQRSGRVLSGAAALGWVLASAIHSVHDGIGSENAVGTRATTGMEQITDPALLPAVLIGANIMTFAFIAGCFVIVRVVAREFVPPTAVVGNPPRWRPRLTQWGYGRLGRERIRSTSKVAHHRGMPRATDENQTEHRAQQTV